MDNFDASSAKSQIMQFITERAAPNGIVLGVSGGIDSALVLALSVAALGKDKVTALLMPETAENLGSTIVDYVKQLGVTQEVIPIKPLFEAYLQHGGVANERLVTGNLKARIRMTLLYSRANANNLVVMGTGNRSELLTGYFTKYGDGGVDYLPIGALYKGQVNELATLMGVPEAIITQAPSAGLWAGQTDEEELGITYKKLDLILHEHIDKGVPFDTINLPDDITAGEVQLVQKRVGAYSFKLLPLEICQLKK